MPVYHVNYHSEAGSFYDEDGLDLCCLGDALQFVFELAKEIRADNSLEGHWSSCRFEVADESGVVVLRIPMTLVMAAITRRMYH